jgi:hypothetical protein
VSRDYVSVSGQILLVLKVFHADGVTLLLKIAVSLVCPSEMTTRYKKSTKAGLSTIFLTSIENNILTALGN